MAIIVEINMHIESAVFNFILINPVRVYNIIYTNHLKFFTKQKLSE